MCLRLVVVFNVYEVGLGLPMKPKLVMRKQHILICSVQCYPDNASTSDSSSSQSELLLQLRPEYE